MPLLFPSKPPIQRIIRSPERTPVFTVITAQSLPRYPAVPLLFTVGMLEFAEFCLREYRFLVYFSNLRFLWYVLFVLIALLIFDFSITVYILKL